MIVAIGSDHAGWELKEALKKVLIGMKVEVKDMGPSGPESVDYPDFGAKVSRAVSKGDVERGVLVCGSGVGMSIVANKFRGVRAALCNDLYTAKMSRLHNDANVLALGSRIVGPGLAEEILKTWIETPFEGGRHGGRIGKITVIEGDIKGK